MTTLLRALCIAALLPAIALAANPPASAAKSSAPDAPAAAPSQLDGTGRIVVHVMIDGQGPFRFLVDTGANGSMISPGLARLLGLVPSHALDEWVQGTTGIEQLPCVTVADLRIGSIVKRGLRMPISIQNLGIVYADVPIFRIWHLDSQPALIIGMNVLGTVSSLMLDYPRAQVYLQPMPPKDFSVDVEDVFFPRPGFDDGGD